MKKVILVAATVFAMSSAFASNNNNGPVTNNNQTYNQPQGGTASATGGNATGGNATALGGTGIGGDSRANAEAYVANLNNVKTDVNTNVNTSIKNDVKNNNSNVGVNAQGQKQSVENSNNAKQTTKVKVEGDSTTFQAQKRDPVATAYAASIAPTAVCALSVSGGVQAVGFGMSFGKSFIDENCVLLEQARAASNLGEREVAVEMLMDIPAFAAAKQRIADRKAAK